MHLSAMNNCVRFYNCYGKYFDNPKILDVGSYDVNGSLRSAFPAGTNYIGADIESGPNVDMVFDSHYKFPIEDNSIDIVVSSSCFEHSEMFWVTFLEVMRVLKPKGLFYMNAPSNGSFHRWPQDCWRFYPDAGHALVTWAKYNNYDAALLESFWSAPEADNNWRDFVGVFIKDEQYVKEMPNRILHSFIHFWNGKTYENGRQPIMNFNDTPHS